MNPIKFKLAALVVATLASCSAFAQAVSTRGVVHPPPDPALVAARMRADAAANAAAQEAERRDLAAQKKASVESEQRNQEYAKQLNQQAVAQAAAQRKAIWDKESAALQEQRKDALTKIRNESAAEPQPQLEAMKEKVAKLQSQLATQSAKLDNSGLKQQIAAYTEIIQRKEDERRTELAQKIAAVEADYKSQSAALPDKVKNILLQNQAEQKRVASAKTIAWLKEKAAGGDAGSQYSLGERYLNGDGVDQDKAKAHDYFKAAADQGHEEAASALKQLAASSN